MFLRYFLGVLSDKWVKNKFLGEKNMNVGFPATTMDGI